MARYCRGCGKSRDEALVASSGATCIVCEDQEPEEDQDDDDDQEE